VKATSVADSTKSATASVTVVVPVQHTATLSWVASSTPVVGYNVYRSTQSGGPYNLVNTSLVGATSFGDHTVASGTTYYYVTTAVDSAATESAFSNQTVAVIPIP
jgi:fibronectin type 3 domain-containing protein